MLTLVGPGGSGKTRLAIQVANEAAEEFPDGVYFVSLGAIGDPGLIPSAIAQSLGLRAASDRPLMERLVGRLRDREILVVLDNFEHLLDAASMVAELLKATDPARVMVTSRSPLHISGEQQFAVPPLAVPDLSVGVTAAAVGSCESVQLFVERASAAWPGFALSDTNAGLLAEITRRLDGLPLAIELAAARVTVLPPETMLARLEASLGLLVGGARDLPDRQRTLRATIAWSYELLSGDGQVLLAICSVFRGGADLEMIESLSEHTVPAGLPVVDVLQELTDQSLIHRVERWRVPRFSMLETIGEFGVERLEEMPDAARIREGHAGLFLSLAEDANRAITGPEENQWLQRLDVEHNNIRAAIDWYRKTSPPAALRLAAAMAGFWSRRDTSAREDDACAPCWTWWRMKPSPEFMP
ncbi:MAG: ATP-binding protein [Acidimicrobiales bacterium]